MITSWLDFWTSNSTIWYNDWEISQLINLDTNKHETRTVVLASTEEMKMIVWTEWIKRYVNWATWRLLQAPKSFLNSQNELKTVLIWKQFTLTEIVASIIKDFKSKLENTLQQSVDHVLVWRPVNFHDENKELDLLAQNRLENATKMAWFKYVEFQFEPLAAAKTYQCTLESWKKENVIIADLGWGTSDFSLLQMTSDEMKILWNTGIYIGWNNFDKRLSYDFFCNFIWRLSKQSSMWKTLDMPNYYFHTLSDWKQIYELSDKKNKLDIQSLYARALDKNAFSRLLEIANKPLLWYKYFEQVEGTKKILSTRDSIAWSFWVFENTFDYEISQKIFEELIQDEIWKIIKTVQELLIQTWLKVDEIDKIFLTWGSSFLPIVQREIEALLWKWKIVENERFSSIWYWLTLESYERFR